MKKILKPEIQQFINENLNIDLNKFLLKKQVFEDVSQKEIATQILGKQKCKDKLPTWFKAENMIFPEKLSLEQTSSEKTALYKSNLVYGDLLDCTAGFGVDSYFFAQKCKKVVHCERKNELSSIVKHNFSVLNVKNIEFFCGNFEDFLQKAPKNFDFIYLDPARRDKNKQKVFFLEDCEPNILEKLDFLFNFSEKILIKLSPMLDISLSIKNLPQTKEIHILSVENEVKELLFFLEKHKKNENILIKTINLKKNITEEFSFVWGEKPKKIEFSYPEYFLYEPNASILKSGGMDFLTQRFNIKKIAPKTNLFTSKEIEKEFLGRCFEIISVKKFNKNLKNELKNLKASVNCKNFLLSVGKIREKFQIKDGDELFLFFTSTENKEKIVIFCRKI